MIDFKAASSGRGTPVSHPTRRQLLLLALSALLVSHAAAGSLDVVPGAGDDSGVRGAIANPSGPGVAVYAYSGHLARPTGPGFVAATNTDAAGAFTLSLPPGPYTLGVRWRASGQPLGPLTPGDRVAVAQVSIEAGRFTDVGILSLREIDPAVRATISLRDQDTSGTRISGRVVSPEGRALPGLFVLAFLRLGLGEQPVAHSMPSAPDGGFSLPLPSGGSYFVVARSHSGGPLQPGETVGTYAGTDGRGVAVKEGEHLEGIEVTAEVLQ